MYHRPVRLSLPHLTLLALLLTARTAAATPPCEIRNRPSPTYPAPRHTTWFPRVHWAVPSPGATLKRPAVEDQAGDGKADIANPDKTTDPDPTAADLLIALATDAAEESEGTLGSRHTP